MTSSPVMSTGMTTAAAGAGGVLTGDTGGLDGLFSMLMGSATPLTGPDAAPVGGTPVVGDGMISVLLGVKPVASTDATGVDAGTALSLGGLTQIFATPTDVLQTEEVQLGDGPVLTVSGEEETLAAFVQKLKDIYQKVVVEGGLTIGQLSDSKELAGALTKLGMAPDEAMGVAERIQTMMKLLKQQQDVDDETAGSLVAMMLAVMGQNGAPAAVTGQGDAAAEPTFGLQIMSVEDKPVTAAGGQTSAMAAWQMRMSGDVTRDLLGLGGKAAASDVAMPDTGDMAAGKTEAGRKVELTLTTDGDAAIGVAVPEIKPAPVPQPATVAPTVPSAVTDTHAQTDFAMAGNTTATAVKVMADEKIEAPKGETYYRLQADKHGVETLEAVKPLTDVKDMPQVANQATGAAMTQALGLAQAETPAHLTAAGAGYAERITQIQDMVEKAGVGKQVNVQMQPLLEQGGGTVRINLNPRELGQITVELTVKDGSVHGAIAASEPAVVEQLARELHSLRHGLADAGLKVGEQGINLMLSNSNHQSGNQGQTGQESRATADAMARHAGVTAGAAAMGEDLATNLSGWVSPDRVLDVNV